MSLEKSTPPSPSDNKDTVQCKEVGKNRGSMPIKRWRSPCFFSPEAGHASRPHCGCLRQNWLLGEVRPAALASRNCDWVTMAPSKQHSVPSLERALSIAEALGEARKGLSLSEVSRKLSLPKSHQLGYSLSNEDSRPGFRCDHHRHAVPRWHAQHRWM